MFVALAVALILAAPVGCATQTIRGVAAEHGVEVTPELAYFGVLKDYNEAKRDALAYAALPSTSAGEVESILRVLNGGTSDSGCFVGSIEPRCLDGSDGAIRAFEVVRLRGGMTEGRFETLSFVLSTAAAQIRASGGGE